MKDQDIEQYLKKEWRGNLDKIIPQKQVLQMFTIYNKDLLTAELKVYSEKIYLGLILNDHWILRNLVYGD